MGWCRVELTPEAWARLNPAQREAFARENAEMNAEADRLDPLTRRGKDHPSGYRYYGEGERDA